MKTKKTKSKFARALQSLLDESGVFSKRADWSDVLGVSEGAISQWLSDRTIPRPDVLYVVYHSVEITDVGTEQLATFRDMAALPAEKASPIHGRKMLPTVWSYMMRQLYDENKQKVVAISAAKNLQVIQTAQDQDHELQQGSYKKISQIQPLDQHQTETIWSSEPEFVESTELPYIEPRFKIESQNEIGTREKREINWCDVVQGKRIFLSGGPGCGKTSFLRYLTKRLPAEIEYFKVSSLQGVTDIDQLQSALNITPQRIESDSQDWILLDALDEVSVENRHRLRELLDSVFDRYSSLCFVVTCRSGAYDWHRDDAFSVRFSMPDFDELQNAFLKRPWKDTKGVSRWMKVPDYMSELAERPDLVSCVVNPLLFRRSETMFFRNATTARSEAELLDDFIWLLCDELDRNRNVVRSSESWASPRNVVSAVSALSYQLYRTCQDRFTAKEAKLWLEDAVNDADPQDVLRVISESTGLIERKTTDSYLFTNKNFKSYLAARYAVESGQPMQSLLEEEVPASHWGDLVHHIAGITTRADGIIDIVMQSDILTHSQKVCSIARIIDQKFSARQSKIEDCSNLVADHLEKLFQSWKIVKASCGGGVFGQTWELHARRVSNENVELKDFEPGKHVISAIHRGRKCQAGSIISQRLDSSDVPVVREIAGSMQSEGKLRVKFKNHRGISVRASVG